jgi:hypothetical protein
MIELVLTPAELAVTLHALAGSALALDASALQDLDVAEADLVSARTSLLERGILVCAPFEPEEMAGVSTAYVGLLETAVTPDELCALRIAQRDAEPRQIYYSFAEQRLVRNCVEASRSFTFAELPSVQAMIDDMIRESVGDVGQLSPQPLDQVAPLADLLRTATSMSVLMRVEEPANPQGSVRALSWIVSDRALWLLTGEGAAETAQRVDTDRLRTRLTQLLEIAEQLPSSDGSQ